MNIADSHVKPESHPLPLGGIPFLVSQDLGICQFKVFIPSRKTNAKGEWNSGYLFVHEIEKSLCSGSSGIAPARPLTLSKRVRHGNRRKFRLGHKNNWQDATSCLFFLCLSRNYLIFNVFEGNVGLRLSSVKDFRFREPFHNLIMDLVRMNRL